jgi:hypothetical protein
MSTDNKQVPSRFEATIYNVATAIVLARASTPDLKYGGIEHAPGEIERLVARGDGKKVWVAWVGPKEEALYAAMTGNGPTSEVNAMFFAHARDIVITVGEDWQRYRQALMRIVRESSDSASKAVAAEVLGIADDQTELRHG